VSFKTQNVSLKTEKDAAERRPYSLRYRQRRQGDLIVFGIPILDDHLYATALEDPRENGVNGSILRRRR
jgi:hypothetical protein